MTFHKTFPRNIEGSSYPRWEEISLTDKEEKEQDLKAKKENIALMKECINDAKAIMGEKQLKDFQTDLISIAITLFEKRASHSVYHKENKAKEKFDKLFP